MPYHKNIVKQYPLTSHHKKILSDTLTPVSAYLKLRDHFPHSLLLESSDYQSSSNNFSYICCNPIAFVKIQDGILTQKFPDGNVNTQKLAKNENVATIVHAFMARFEYTALDFKFVSNGLFGYIAHEAIAHFENIELDTNKQQLDIPDIYYAVYQNIIAISLFNHEGHLFSHTYEGESNLDAIEALLKRPVHDHFEFETKAEKSSNLSDNDFLDLVRKGKRHCYRGDVFQLVLSRRFSQKFKGDEFKVYRALRSINPSPYLFFFDYGDFKIFGSSPEIQIIVQNGKAEIHPIAGTFKRTGNDTEDAILAAELLKDPKENSEHVMLLDLARNDLSRNGFGVKVEKDREIQFFSHVIHLVSKVTGTKNVSIPTFQLVADTFPAGTLSGAPKFKALELINRYEKTARNFYGGAIGYMDFKGNFNHAIVIRSFLSKNHELHYQAGAGIVADSVPEKELEEVYNKLGALDKALEIAENYE